MKKSIILLVIFSTFLFASFPKMDTLLSQQSAIATAVNSYIRDRGSIPANITVLKNANYLLATFDEKNPVDGDNITFAVGSNEVAVNSQIEVAKTDAGQEDYYINSFTFRELGRISKIGSGQLVSYYSLSAKSALDLHVDGLFGATSFKGDLTPEQYSAVANGNYWFSSTFRDDMYQFYVRNSGAWNKYSNVNQNTATIALSKSYWTKSQVNVAQNTNAIKCNNGATWNGVKQRCEAYTSNSCDIANGMIWNNARNRCERTPICPSGAIYDTTINKCVEYVSKISTTNSVTVRPTYCTSHTTYYTLNAHAGGISCKSTSSCGGGNANGSGGQNGGCTTYSSMVKFDNNCNITAGLKAQTGCGQASASLAWGGARIFVRYNSTKWVSKMGDVVHNTSSGTTTQTQTIFTCPTGYVDNGSNCKKNINSTCPSGTTFDTISDKCYEASKCSGHKMPVTPFYNTPYNGNNGVCYSDAGLYCKNTGVSWDGVYTCYDNTQHCDDATWNLNLTNNYCEKYNYTCNVPTNRYGLSESPTNNNATDLYNRIANKDDKLNAVVSSILSGNVNVNDNAGSMCVKLDYNTFIQPSTSPTYTINGTTTSGF